MADRAPLVGMLDAVPDGQQPQAPLMSMPGFDIDPMSGYPMSPGMDKIVRGLAQGLVNNVKTPGAVMRPNPYPAGSEEAVWYDQNRADTMANWAPRTAMGMVGDGAPMAEGGALGSGGGWLRFPDKAAARTELNRSSRIIDKYDQQQRAWANGEGPKLTPAERAAWQDAFKTKQDAQEWLTSSQVMIPHERYSQALAAGKITKPEYDEFMRVVFGDE